MSTEVIVFGGTGLVGRSLKYLQPSWIYLGSKDGDLRNMRKCIKIFQKYKPKKVIFLAALVGGLYKNLNANYEMFLDNMKMQMNIIECCNNFNIKDAVFCLSTCVYPNKVSYPIKEEYLHNGPPHSSNYGYAYAKRNLEIMCRLSNERFESNFKCITPTNIYGEYDNFDLKNGHVIPSLIHKAYLAKKNKIDFTILGSGKPLRQFIYSGDVAKVIETLLMNPFIKVDNVIVTLNEEISIKDLGYLIARNFEIPKKNIIFDTSFADGQYKKTCSNEKLLQNVDINFTPLEDGLENTITWFKKHYPNVRK